MLFFENESFDSRQEYRVELKIPEDLLQKETNIEGIKGKGVFKKGIEDVLDKDVVTIQERKNFADSIKSKEDSYEEEYNGDKIVVEIWNEEDYGFSPQKKDSGYYHFLAKFFTSKSNSTNLKNIMVFGEK